LSLPKILFTGDIHIRLKNDRRYQKDLLTFMQYLLTCIDQIKPEYTIITGDLFDTKHPTTNELALATSIISKIVNNTKLIIIPGNHDEPDNDDLYNTLQPMANLNIKNLHILSTPDIYHFDGLDILAIPYIYRDKAQALQELKMKHDAYTGDNLIAIGHFWAENYMSVEPPASEFVVTQDYMSSLTKVQIGVLGHLHEYGQAHPKFFYTGSPYRITLGEQEAQKYMLLWDNGLKTIATPALPIKVLEFNKIMAEDMTLENHIIVIKTKDLDIANMVSIDNLRKHFSAKNFVSVDLNLKKIQYKANNLESTPDTSLPTYIDDYVKRHDLVQRKQLLIDLCSKIVAGQIADTTDYHTIKELYLEDL
jgi:DNA repair exonuclease SbcCD nuclease subunit